MELQGAELPASDSLTIDAQLRHQLRTPLNQILGYAELLIEESEETNDTRNLPELQRIQRAGHQLLELINQHFAERDQPPGQGIEGGAASPPSIHAFAGETPTRSGSTPPSAQDTSLAGASLTGAPLAPDSAPHQDSAPYTACILVVDDEPGNRELLMRRLEHEGHSVMTAQGGVEALALLGTRAFDLVLLDALMPDVSGIEVLQQMHTDQHLQRVPVIMLSALDDLSHVVRCIELGAEDYLSKPFNPVILRARINASLEKKRLRDMESQLFEQLQGSYDRLSQLERWREDWTQMLVHDLRTPLTAILGSLQTLTFASKRASVPEDLRDELVDISTQGAQNMLSLVNDLLDTAQLESGAFKLDATLVDVRALVTEVVTQMKPLALTRDMQLLSDLPASEELTIRADVGKLTRVLVNLLANGIKFTPARGKVSIEVARRPDTLRFAVRDTGEGIPPAALQLIFEKFGRAEAKHSGYQNSTGLGLTFCKMVVEAHGSTLHVESEVGAGSTFYFDLPTA